MLRKIIPISLVLSTSLFCSSDINIHNEKSSLSKLLSQKETKLDNNLYMKVDLSSALAIVDERFLIDNYVNAPKRISPEKCCLTLSYKF